MKKVTAQPVSADIVRSLVYNFLIYSGFMQPIDSIESDSIDNESGVIEQVA